MPNPMQEMLARAQRMQRVLAKAHEALAATEFKVSKAGIVDVVMMGDRTIKSINIDSDAFDPENKEMIEETIALAISEVLGQIDAAHDAIEENVTGQKGGFGF